MPTIKCYMLYVHYFCAAQIEMEIEIMGNYFVNLYGVCLLVVLLLALYIYH